MFSVAKTALGILLHLRCMAISHGWGWRFCKGYVGHWQHCLGVYLGGQINCLFVELFFSDVMVEEDYFMYD